MWLPCCFICAIRMDVACLNVLFPLPPPLPLPLPLPLPQRLVSCGRENVRFWRVRRRHLPACPAVLNDFARDLECTDLAFQSSCRGIAGVVSEAESAKCW